MSSPDAGPGDTIEVVGSDAPDPATTPGAVTSIPLSAAPPGDDLAAVLDRAAGTTIRRLGGLGDFSAVSIRGSALRQVEVFLDGIPLNPDGMDAQNLSDFPISAFSRIDLWRGYAPPELGVAPMGGAIDLVTGDERPANASLTAGSWGTSRVSGLVALPGKAGGWDLDTRLVGDLLATDGDFRYYDDGATPFTADDDRIRKRADNGKAQASLLGRWRLERDATRLTILGSLLRREEGLPGQIGLPADGARLTTTRPLGAVRLEAGPPDRRITALAWGTDRVEEGEDPAGSVWIGPADRREEVGSAGLSSTIRLAPTPWLSPAFTLGGRADRLSARDRLAPESVGPPATRLAMDAGISATISGSRWALAPVVDLDARLDRRGDDDLSILLFNPRLAALWRPSPLLTIKADAGRAARMPDLTERFGNRGIVEGNPDLRAERGAQVDLGFVWKFAPAPWFSGSLESMAFYAPARDRVVYLQNAQRILYPVNLSNSRVGGLECAADLKIGPLRSATSLTRTLSENLDPRPAYRGRPLPRIPGWDVSQRTALDLGDRASIAHTFGFASGSAWDETAWYRAPPRVLHGVTAEVRLGRGVSLSFDVRNLTDRISADLPPNPFAPPGSPGSSGAPQAITDFAGYPLPGRTILIGARYGL